MIRDLLLRGIKQQELFKVTSSNYNLTALENLVSELPFPCYTGYTVWENFGS